MTHHSSMKHQLPDFADSSREALDRAYMSLAIEEAKLAAETGDVPVGAVLVDDRTDSIIATGHNTRELHQTALGHAEIDVIQKACSILDSWRLAHCTLYVTLEPCPMCAGAILHARIPRVVYGAPDPVAGAMGSVWALHTYPIENQHTTVTGNCCEGTCRELLQAFFQKQRMV